MNPLQQFLTGLKYKTVFITVLLAVITALNGVIITEPAMTIYSLICGVLLIVFKKFAPTGEFPKGWAFWFYISNGLIVLLEIGDLISGSALIGPNGRVLIQQVQLYLNSAFAGLQVVHNSQGGNPPSVPPGS